MKLDETKLQKVVEKIAYQQFGAEQIDDLYAKMEILNNYVQEQLRLFAVVGQSKQLCHCGKPEEKAFAIHNINNCPSELEPVLAKIEHIDSLGKSSWYEVVYFDKYWRSYNGSSTFKDGEKVVRWRYCKDCF